MALTRITMRLVLASLIAAGLVVGVAGSASATIPIGIDVNAGFVFTGIETTSYAPRAEGPPLPINPPASVPPTTTIPFNGMIPGPAPTVTLGYEWEEHRTYLLPACNQSVFRTITRSTFKAVVQYTTNVPGLLPLVGLQVVIPTLVNDNETTVLPFDAFSLGAAITSNGTTTNVSLAPTTPPPGAAAAFLVTMPANVTVTGDVGVEVTVGGPAASPVPINLTGLVPVPGGPCFNTLGRQGAATVEIQNMSVNLLVADRLVLRPENVTVTPDDSQVFAAFRCPNLTDDPFGADGEPGTGDDLCFPLPGANWSVSDDDLGTLSVPIGATTVFQPALPPGTSQQTGQVIVTDGSDQAVAIVTVTANALVFADSQGQKTGSVQSFQPAPRDELRIRAEQELIEALDRLVIGFSAFPRVAAFFQRQLDLARNRLRALVPADVQFTAEGPDLGVGDVPATLTSFDANGDPIEAYDLTLSPGSPVRSAPLVAIPPGSPIASGPAAGLVFVRAQLGGRLLVQAPGYAGTAADIIDSDTE